MAVKKLFLNISKRVRLSNLKSFDENCIRNDLELKPQRYNCDNINIKNI